MTVILSHVTLEHLDDRVQMRLDVADVRAQTSIRGAKLLVGPRLRIGDLGNAVNDSADDRGQTNDPLGHQVGFRLQFLESRLESGMVGGRICRELRLLSDHKLHRSLHLLR